MVVNDVGSIVITTRGVPILPLFYAKWATVEKIKKGCVKYRYLVIDIYRDKVVNARNFVNATNPWFKRGGNYNNGANAGAWNFNNNNGNVNSNNSFRSVARLQYYKIM